VHQRQRRSKRLLLTVLILIAAAQLGVGLLLDLDPLKVRFRPAESIIANLCEASRHPDILFLGSSRFGDGIKIGELQKAMNETFGKEAPLMVNCAFPAADPYSMDFLLRHILRRGITPAMVVMEISPETVMLGGPYQGGQVTRILTLKDMPEAAADLIAFGKLTELMDSRLIPIYTFRMELLTYLFGDSPPYLAPPAGILSPVPAPTAAKAQAAALPRNVSRVEKENRLRLIQSARPNVQSWLRGFRIKGLNVRHLESMLAYFQTHGIAAILVGVPVTKMHFECYSQEINLKFLDYMNTLARTYGCRFVDYRDRFADDLFYDHHHLTPEGGSEFCQVFQEEVLCQAWRKGPMTSRRTE